MKHAVLSPSSSHRWLTCHGSALVNKGKPHTQSHYALEGTTAHGLLEVCLRLDDEPTNYLGAVLAEGHMAITEDMADSVGYALDYVRAYLADHKGAVLYVEHLVKYGKAIGTSDANAFGTSDVLIDYYPHELVVLDYKHGIGIPVSVKENPQLRMYALGMRQQKGCYRRYRKVVIQPRLPRRKPVQEHTITDDELNRWLAVKVRPVVPIVLAPNAPRVAGKHCRYCVADGNCTAQYKLIMDAAKKEFKA